MFEQDISKASTIRKSACSLLCMVRALASTDGPAFLSMYAWFGPFSTSQSWRMRFATIQIRGATLFLGAWHTSIYAPPFRHVHLPSSIHPLSSRPRADYISAILSPNTWGGAIELTILATHYATEIASVDVETGRVDRFTPPAGAGNRVLLIYSGIHYDAALLAPELGVPEEWCASIVPVGSDAVDPNLSALKALAGKLRAKRQYTNTTTFDLKCEVRRCAFGIAVLVFLTYRRWIVSCVKVCGKGLKGEKEARAHASETGHVKFGEY